MQNRILRILAPALLAVMSLGPAASQAATLNFSGNICGAAGDQACGNGSQIGQSYGDIAGQLDISYRSGVVATGATFEPYLKHWSTSYSDLTNVAWGGANASSYFSEITFTPLAGFQVTLSSFDFGDYQNRNNGSSVAIYNSANAVIWNGGAFDPGPTATQFTPNITGSSPLVLRWGPDSYDVGIDNVQFSVTAVPEPSTYALMLAGLGFVGFVAHRRRNTASRT